MIFLRVHRKPRRTLQKINFKEPVSLRRGEISTQHRRNSNFIGAVICWIVNKDAEISSFRVSIQDKTLDMASFYPFKVALFCNNFFPTLQCRLGYLRFLKISVIQIIFSNLLPPPRNLLRYISIILILSQRPTLFNWKMSKNVYTSSKH